MKNGSMNQRWPLALAVWLAVASVGCGNSDNGTSDAQGADVQDSVIPPNDTPAGETGADVSGDTQSAGGQLLISDKPRVVDPAVLPEDLAALVAGNTAFALDLYRVLRPEAQNLFYSPYSISAALAMTYAGARATSAAQMAQTLHFTLEPTPLHAAFNALDQALASRNEGAFEQEIPFRLHISNALWGLTGYPFRSDFLDTLAQNYGAGLRLLDFAADPDNCRQIINDWVADQTEQKILDLIPGGAINDLTRLVLTNAIYFNAAWNAPFDSADTADGAFHLIDSTTATVSQMHMSEMLPYAEGAGWQALELPYDGGQLSMVVLLPAADNLEAFEAALDPAFLAALETAWQFDRSVELTMPRFQVESSFRMKDTLTALGMTDPFIFGVADFSGMADTHELFISNVIHKAYVSVDEAGTEAAAATAVIMEGSGIPDPATFTIDHPFLFIIRDRPTGAILFVGRVVDPH